MEKPKLAITIEIRREYVHDRHHNDYSVTVISPGDAARPSEPVPQASPDEIADHVGSIVRDWVKGDLRSRFSD